MLATATAPAGAVLLSACEAVSWRGAQRRHARVGILVPVAPSQESWDAFRAALRDVGWIEDQNLTLEWAIGGADAPPLPELAANLVNREVDIIVSEGSSAVAAARDASNRVPIVMVAVDDPVRIGLVESLARPSGNVTGLTSGLVGTDVRAKRLELFHAVLPRLQSMIAVIDSSSPATAPGLFTLQTTADRLGIEVFVLDATSASIDLDAAMHAAAPNGADGLLVAGGLLFRGPLRVPLVQATARALLPAMYFAREFVAAGGLLSYGANIVVAYPRAAWYVDRILNGARPAELPVEQPRVLELFVNRATAEAFDLTIPAHVAAQVTEWID
jgi:putative ABC transport system substrate-binding protein